MVRGGFIRWVCIQPPTVTAAAAGTCNLKDKTRNNINVVRYNAYKYNIIIYVRYLLYCIILHKCLIIGDTRPPPPRLFTHPRRNV